ncbi:MAG: LamG-like jellyroll fold domain-containing protein, partial [bacterium]
MVAYYPLDNDLLDYSGNDLDGSPIGTPTHSADRFNLTGSVVTSDQNYIKIADNPSLRLSTNFSIVTWIYSTNPTAPTSANLQGILSKYQSGGDNAYSLRLESGKLNLAGGASITCPHVVQANKWTQVIAVIQNNTAKLYSDGKEVCNLSGMNISGASTNPITLGNDYTTGGSSENRGFQGRLDDIRIYNRIINEQEIKALYAVADPNPPEITSSTPANNATGFGVADNLTITFDKPLDGSTIQASSVELRRSDNTTVAGNLYLDPNDNRSLIFDPIDNLSSLTNYTLYLHSSIRDSIGNSISPTQIPFQTQMLGGGTTDQPYLIGSPEGLVKINDNLTANYRLSNDIQLVEPWVPLNNFTGILYGDNHNTISNLQISSSTNYVGLFSNMNNAQILDLKLDKISIQAPCRSYVGSLVGEMTASTIQNVHVRNIELMGGNETGGLIGRIAAGDNSSVDQSSTENGIV